jgi:hypothetical protein
MVNSHDQQVETKADALQVPKLAGEEEDLPRTNLKAEAVMIL